MQKPDIPGVLERICKYSLPTVALVHYDYVLGVLAFISSPTITTILAPPSCSCDLLPGQLVSLKLLQVR